MSKNLDDEIEELIKLLNELKENILSSTSNDIILFNKFKYYIMEHTKSCTALSYKLQQTRTHIAKLSECYKDDVLVSMEPLTVLKSHLTDLDKPIDSILYYNTILKTKLREQHYKQNVFSHKVLSEEDYIEWLNCEVQKALPKKV